MATMSAQGTQPVAGGDINAEPITDTQNNIMTTYNGENADENNCDYTSSDGVMVLGQAQANISGHKTFQDDVEVRFGTGTDYWWVYDASNTKLDLYSTDVDGAGANGIVISVNDGTDDLTFTGSLVLAASETITFGTGETIGGDNTDLTVTSGGAINLTATTDVVVPANVGITFGSGEKIEGDNTDLTVTSGGAINLTAVTDVVVPANVGVTFGTGEKIEGDNTDLTITSGGAINLTAVTDVVVPANVGVTFGTGEKIEGDNTDLTITSGADIALTATGDVNLPANVGMTFGDDGEKIEGDGTDLTIAGNNINLTATADVVVPANVGVTFGTGEKIEGNNTDLTVTSGGAINLTAVTDVVVPANVGVTFGTGEKIEGDNTDLTITSGGDVLLTMTGTVYLNETANANMTTGLTIMQGAADNQTFCSKSSDVAHGMTDYGETDDWLNITKAQGTSGGALVRGLKDGDGSAGYALWLDALLGESADTTKSTAAIGNFYLRAAAANGVSIQTVGTDGNLVVFADVGTARFIFDAEGSGHADVEWTTYSDKRLKSNIALCPYGLAEVLKLQPSIFDRESGAIEKGEVVKEGNTRRMIGFVAQDVKESIPELVRDIDEATSFYSLDHGRMTPVLWRAVQELESRVKALEA